jgi:hypothetical protein
MMNAVDLQRVKVDGQKTKMKLTHKKQTKKKLQINTQTQQLDENKTCLPLLPLYLFLSSLFFPISQSTLFFPLEY